MMEILNLLVDPLQYAFMQRAFVASVLVGIVCGVLGCYIVLRRMALIGDALAHAVLPGVAVAFIIGADFFLGAVVAGVVTAVLIGWVTDNSRIKEDAAIGVVFTGAFALGIVLITLIQSRSVDLMHMLFGNVLGVEDRDLGATALIAGIVLVAIVVAYKELLLHVFDPILAAAIGLPRQGLHYFLMVLLSLTVVASLQTVGLVLVVAMLITPASTAYLLTDRFSRMLLLSAGIGVLSAISGLYASYYWNVSSGAAIVLTATGIFFITLLIAPKRGLIVKKIRQHRAARRTALEDALKHLYLETPLDGEEPGVDLDQLAARMGVSRLAVQTRLRLLRRKGFMKGDRLTPEGENRALHLVRAHRLWERYLVDQGVATDEDVHAEAERFEHLETRRMASRLDRELGSPDADPHGTPIPPPAERSLADLPEGRTARIVALRVTDSEALHRLADAGFVVGAQVRSGAWLSGGDRHVRLDNGADAPVHRLPERLCQEIVLETDGRD